MSGILLILTIITVALWFGAANKIVQVWRAPDDQPLRAVAAGMICISGSATLSLPSVSAALNGITPGLAVLAINAISLGGAFWLMAFFRYSAHPAAAGRWVRAQAVPLLAAELLLVLSWLLAPPAVRAGPTDLANGRDWHSTVFVLAAVGYMALSLALSLRWSLRYARVASRVQLRRGLRTLSVAVAALITACLLKVCNAVGIWSLPPDAPALRLGGTLSVMLVAFGMLTFLIGLSYPSAAGMIAAFPVWRWHRRAYRELFPLWRALHEAFPDLALSRGPATRWYDMLGLRRTHRSYYRRAVEIRDGLVQLGPYYARDDSEPDGSPAEQAERVAVALAAKAAGAEPAAPPHPIPLAGGENLDADVRWLVELARALDTGKAADYSV